VARLTTFVAVVLFAGLTAVVALQVLNRMVLHLPLIWSEELARFLFFWVALLGAAVSVRKRRHFVLDVGMGRARPRGWRRSLSQIFPNLAVIAFSIFLLIAGVGYLEAGRYRTATNSDINMGFVYAAIPVFALLSIAYAGANLLADVRALDRERRTGAASADRRRAD
jgi:TRAP-type C4-dicarboxylate transport system permease small subunit